MQTEGAQAEEHDLIAADDLSTTTQPFNLYYTALRVNT